MSFCSFPVSVLRGVVCCLAVMLGVLAPGLRAADESSEQTIATINQELDVRLHELPSKMKAFQQILDGYIANQKKKAEELNKLGVILYSQDATNMFALAFYCQQVMSLRAELKTLVDNEATSQTTFTFERAIKLLNEEKTRLDGLKNSIAAMDDATLSEESRKAKAQAVKKCDKLNKVIDEYLKTLTKEKGRIGSLNDKSAALETYAADKLQAMVNTVFYSPVSVLNYFSSACERFKEAFIATYVVDDSSTERTKEVWKMVKGIALFLVVSYLLARLTFRVGLKKILMKRNMMEKAPYHICWSTLLYLAVFMSIGSLLQPLDFMRAVMTTGIEFLMTLALITFSVTVRLPYEKVRQGLLLYAPGMVLCTVFIFLRMSMAPNIIVNMTLPLLFPLVFAWNVWILVRNKQTAPPVDKFFSTVSCVLIGLASICSLIGFSFLFFLVMLAWIMLLTSILFLMAFYHLVHIYQKKRSLRVENAGHRLQPFMSKFVLPVMSLLLIMFSLLWPASIFNIAHLIREWASTPFIVSDFAQSISVNAIITVIFMAITLRYVIFVVKTELHEKLGEEYDLGGYSTYMTLGTFVLWGVYVLISLAVFQVNFTGIMMILGGMSMGLGFALKDTIDNIICGLSLMFGRLRQGDIVECDGIRGKVSSIGYRTTYIETLDGSVIAFQNNQLFNKNFRNMTSNHVFEQVKVEIGIAYGTEVDKARTLILEAVKDVEGLSKTRNTSVVLDGFGDNSVNLGVWVWAPVRMKMATLSRVREAIYRTFNENGISIPFPQQDVYIKEVPRAVVVEEKGA